MSNKLDQILLFKKNEVENKKTILPFSELIEKAVLSEPVRNFSEAIKTHDSEGICCIAEIKKASPSKGVIAKTFNVSNIAHEYSQGGANAISVLTDVKYFQGNDEYVALVKKTIEQPVLRKEFIIDEYQIYESRLIGADAILLIAAALSDYEIRSFLATARDLSLSVLVECHTKKEIDRAVDCGAEIIGINNRDLKTFTVDIETSLNLKRFVPNSCISVSESGIRNNYTVRQLIDVGFDAILVGEHLMIQKDKRLGLKELLYGNAS